MPSAPRQRRFAMTYNNYTPAGYVILQTQAQQIFDKYFVAGKEVGADGTPHLQMYGECTNKYDIVGIKSRLTTLYRDFIRIHIEVAGGNGPQNFQYCSKDGDFFELGTRPQGRGKRTDLDDACDAVKAGNNMREVATEHSSCFVKYSNGLIRLMSIISPKRDFMTIGYWLHGPTGSGKSRWVHQNFPTAYWKPSLDQWFDGYAMEDTVVIDDFRVDVRDHTSLRSLLRLVDRYPLQVPIKGAFVQFVAKRVIITSPDTMEKTFETFTNQYQEDIQQLIRRFPHQLRFDHNVTIPNFLQVEGININNGRPITPNFEENEDMSRQPVVSDVPVLQRLPGDQDFREEYYNSSSFGRSRDGVDSTPSRRVVARTGDSSSLQLSTQEEAASFREFLDTLRDETGEINTNSEPLSRSPIFVGIPFSDEESSQSVSSSQLDDVSY